jgi:hypothetical protein
MSQTICPNNKAAKKYYVKTEALEWETRVTVLKDGVGLQAGRWRWVVYASVAYYC